MLFSSEAMVEVQRLTDRVEKLETALGYLIARHGKNDKGHLLIKELQDDDLIIYAMTLLEKSDEKI